MKAEDYKIIVGLYLRGNDLDPEFISRKLGISPSQSQYKGEKKVTSTNHEYVTKIGMWGLTTDVDSCILADHINQLTSKVGMAGIVFRDLVGVEEAYVDVFIAAKADEDIEGTCEFELTKENLVALEQIGLPVRFTFTLVR